MTMHVILSLIGYFVFSAAVGSMYPPTPAQEPRFYGWLYRTMQRLAANADRLAQARFPGIAAIPTNTDAAAISSTATSTIERRIEVATSSATQ